MMQKEGTPQCKDTVPAANELEKDINGLVNRLDEKLMEVRPIRSVETLTISVVPAHSRALGDKWYTPKHVAIGLHHSHSSRLRCEVEKMSYIELLLKSFLPGKTRREKLELLFAKVMQLQKNHQILECYSLNHMEELEKKELQYMLLVDACYLVAQFGRASTGGQDPNWDMLVVDTWYLLENQMPFLVVEEIDKLLTGCTDDGEVLGEFISFATRVLETKGCISKSIFGAIFAPDGRPWEPKMGITSKESDDQQPSSRPCHLLHILHTLLTTMPSEPEGAVTRDDRPSAIARVGCCWRRASEYVYHSNVQFVGLPLDCMEACSVLNVRIQGRKVMFPRLHIEGTTWTLLLNLMALERQQPRLGTSVTAYCMLLSQMASTAEDVKLLQSCGVITTSLGSPDKVAQNIRDLCNGVCFDVDDQETNYLYPILQELEKLYHCRWHKFLSWCRLNYRSVRMIAALIGVITGFILLAAGVISAVYTVLIYEQQAMGHH